MAYIMTHPGTPCLFYDDLLDAKKRTLLETLIEVRQTAGIHCRSEVRIRHAAFEHVAKSSSWALALDKQGAKPFYLGRQHCSPPIEICPGGSRACFVNRSSSPAAIMTTVLVVTWFWQ